MLSKLARWGSLRLTKLVPAQAIARISSHGGANNYQLRYRSLIKPFAFTISVCGVSFVAATVLQYENRKKDSSRFMFGDDFHKFRNRFQNQHTLLSQIKKWWDAQHDGFKVFLGIALINSIVFIGWRIPRFQPFMSKYFVSSVESKSIRCIPMMLSNFSHYSPFHLGMNMLVLYSFSNIGVHLFGKENFLALYLGSGVMSSFTSCFYKVVVNSITPSLGASGAILGILAACCIERPDIQLMIVFLPFFSFSSATALKGLILLDSLGVIMRWGFFDHAAHLGGTLFGIYYAMELRKFINSKQYAVIKCWNDIKQKF